jgi:co-chaperonin GroES (HSP10)
MDGIEVSKGRVILEEMETENISLGGIILTTEQQYPRKGIVRAVYEGKTDEKWLKEGDVVFYDKNNVLPIEHNKKKYLLSNTDYIYAKQS